MTEKSGTKRSYYLALRYNQYLQCVMLSIAFWTKEVIRSIFQQVQVKYIFVNANENHSMTVIHGKRSNPTTEKGPDQGYLLPYELWASKRAMPVLLIFWVPIAYGKTK